MLKPHDKAMIDQLDTVSLLVYMTNQHLGASAKQMMVAVSMEPYQWYLSMVEHLERAAYANYRLNDLFRGDENG
jgi:hypothetical protein